MTTRDRLTIAAAVAVALATSALRPLYEDLGWLLPVLGGVVAVSGAAALARLASVPRGLQPLLALLALLAYTALTFAGSTLAYGLLPTPSTATSLASTFRDGMAEVEVLAPPVPTSPELVLLAVLGAGAVMVAVDTLAVVLRKVAVSGLPLLVLFCVPSAVLPGGIGLVAFVLGAAGWLGVLLADSSDRVSRWGTPLRSARASQGDPSLGRVGRRIGGVALGIAVVVPLLVPGLDGRLLGGNGTGGGLGGSRTTTTYNPLLELGGQLRQQTEQTLFTYSTKEGADYLRLTTLDVFDSDRGWSSSELSADIDEDRVQDGVPRPVGRSAPSETVDITVDLRRLGGPWLPVPAVPSLIDIDGPWLWDAEAETVFSTRTSARNVDEPYTVTISRVQPDVALLRREQSVPARIEDTYAVDPELSDDAEAVLDEVLEGATTDFDKVAALQTYFRDTDFRYDESTSVPPTDSPDGLSAFLETKRGYCEQFASAMAALVRGAGIPARVAIGFLSGSRNDDGSYEVTTSEAHAWPEIWFQGAGWVRFEPTPRSDGVDVEVPDYSVAPPESEDATSPSAAPSAAPAVPQTGPDAAAGALDRGDEESLTGATGELDEGLSRWWLLVPATLALLGVPALLAAVRRRRRWRSPDALEAWASVGDDAVDVGHQWRPADSPRTAAAHLAGVRHLPDDAVEALTRLAAGAERARYARTAPPSEAAALRADAACVRAALLAGASPRERWLARLLPASTVRSTSSRIGTAVADVLDRFDVLVSAVGARLRHPTTRAPRAG